MLRRPLSGEPSFRRGRLCRAAIGIGLLTATIVSQGVPITALASEESNPYVHAIEDVLIEGVEVKGVSRELVAMLETKVHQELMPALKDAQLALLDVYLTPGQARVTQGSARPDDGSYTQSLGVARENLLQAGDHVEAELTSMESVRDNLVSARDATQAAAGGTGSETSANSLGDASEALRTSQFIAENSVDDLVGTTKSDVAAALEHVEAAQATPTGTAHTWRRSTGC